MDAIQEITTLPNIYSNTLQLCILRTEDGFMLRNNSHIQSQTQPCNHVAKPSRSRRFLRLVPAEPHSNNRRQRPVWTRRRMTLHLSLSRRVPVYTYCPRIIINSTPFTLESIPVQMTNYIVNLLIPQITNCMNDPFPK